MPRDHRCGLDQYHRVDDPRPNPAPADLSFHPWIGFDGCCSTGFGLSLLKIRFGASEGRDKQRRATSPMLRGSTLIAMMQAANLREGNDVIARAW
jgi:hypothetical protein